MENKFRQWTLHLVDRYIVDAVLPDSKSFCHVIEFKAFETLKKENEKLKDQRMELTDTLCERNSEIEVLKRKLEKAIYFLETLSSTGSSTNWPHQIISDNALKEIEAIDGK